MLISADTRVPFPRPLVYSTYRDKLMELVPYMPNIRNVQVRSREAGGNWVKFVNEWHGGGDIPTAARAFLNDSMLSWTERAVWDGSQFMTEWQIETHAFTEAVHCVGTNRFFEDRGSTLIQSRGELAIDPRKLKDVPPFLAGMVSGIVEDFLGKKIGPNLVQMSSGVTTYLERQAVTR
ncbi:MAG: hypothetical protein Fur0046_29410 [Cyanobacteria bacterium J069]|nr:MAG: hypothetical protein D6742_02710 [Cyanobacteria bacterium J069]